MEVQRDVYTIEYIDNTDISILFKDTQNADGNTKEIELVAWLFGKADSVADFDGHMREYTAHF